MSVRLGKSEVNAVRAEAAAWLARLRSEERTLEDERGFRAWLAESEDHRAAFETANAIFEMAGAADRRAFQTREPARVSRRHVLRAGVGFAAASMAGIAIYLRSGTTYATDIGEQHKVSLEDGTLVSLDTDTEIHVSMNDVRRRVRLRRGRAHFNVAEDLIRPFQVIAGAQWVTASRGHFDVSRDGMVVSVLLEEGPVQVAPDEPIEGGVMPRLLTPGQLAVFAADKLVREERPEMAQAIAWRHGRLAFFEEPLSEAVAAMNRYTRRPIVILDAEIAQMPISGNYSVGDPQAFATSISVLLPVRVDLERSRITLRSASSGTVIKKG
ncbi:MAG: FecR family protein [Steroidobacter sp.]